MEVIVWSTGESYQKSNKNQKPLLNANNEIISNVAYRGEYTLKKNDKVNEERREEIMERSMLTQTYINPFLSKSIGEVLSDQEKFLIPQNSLIGHEPKNIYSEK